VYANGAGNGANGDVSPRAIASYYEVQGGTPEEKIASTAQRFRISRIAVKRIIQFWWPGPRHIREFTRAR
jgi:hypothetical protein